MKTMSKISILFILFHLLTGCSKVVLKSDSDPSTDLSTLKTFYVKKFPKDKFNVGEKITSTLNQLGFKATFGTDEKPLEDVDVIVTYKDRWMWDITMYMLEIDIQLHEPSSDFIFASGRSFRTSLARKPVEFMVDEVLRDLFKGKVILPERKPEKEEPADDE